MKRGTFLSTIAAIAVMILAMSGTAIAQQPCPIDCTYRIKVSCDISPECFPIKVMTRWECLTEIKTLIISIDGCGVYDLPKPGPCKPPCDMLWVSLDGGATHVFPNGPPTQFACIDGTVLCVSLQLGADGCYTIVITPGPC